MNTHNQNPNLVPSWFGFPATMVDAAIVVQAAIDGRIFLYQASPGGSLLRESIQSGWVFVYETLPHSRYSIDRWKDGLCWTDRRTLQSGFDIYRETTKNPDEMVGPYGRVSYFFLLPTLFHCPSSCWISLLAPIPIPSLFHLLLFCV